MTALLTVLALTGALSILFSLLGLLADALDYLSPPTGADDL